MHLLERGSRARLVASELARNEGRHVCTVVQALVLKVPARQRLQHLCGHARAVVLLGRRRETHDAAVPALARQRPRTQLSAACQHLC
jgi:hypothetical protein